MAQTKSVIQTPKSVTPDWVTPDLFENIIEKDVGPGYKIHNFSAHPGTNVGDNYVSFMLRVHVEVSCNDGSTKNLSYMLKIAQGETKAFENIAKMGLFSKELEVYKDVLPNFTKLYAEKGVQLSFGPKQYVLSRDPGIENVVLEDLKPKGFVNADRLNGLDEEHIQSVLKLLAQYHAASAVFYEKNGPYSPELTAGIYNPQSRPMYEDFYEGVKPVFEQCLREKYENGEYFAGKVFSDIEGFIDQILTLGNVDNNVFNVLNHGDCWTNNILFKYNDKKQIEETLFIDYQVPHYGPPALDLYYFLLSSAKFDLKLERFDYFIEYYHGCLTESLTLLEYPKTLPTLEDIRKPFLKYGFYAKMVTTGVMCVVLLDPNENACMDNLIKNDEDGRNFKRMAYLNPRFMKTMQELLVWMDKRNIL